MAEDRKLEAMLLHLLNTRSDTNKVWIAITVPGYPRFTRDDVQQEINNARRRACRHWWEFWK